jgi:hypothetical protein
MRKKGCVIKYKFSVYQIIKQLFPPSFRVKDQRLRALEKWEELGMLLTGELEILTFTLTSLFVGYKVRKRNG